MKLRRNDVFSILHDVPLNTVFLPFDLACTLYRLRCREFVTVSGSSSAGRGETVIRVTMLGHVVEQRRRTRRACATRVASYAANSPKTAACNSKASCAVKGTTAAGAAPPAVAALRQNNNNSLPPSPMRKK